MSNGERDEKIWDKLNNLETRVVKMETYWKVVAGEGAVIASALIVILAKVFGL